MSEGKTLSYIILPMEITLIRYMPKLNSTGMDKNQVAGPFLPPLKKTNCLVQYPEKQWLRLFFPALVPTNTTWH